MDFSSYKKRLEEVKKRNKKDEFLRKKELLRLNTLQEYELKDKKYKDPVYFEKKFNEAAPMVVLPKKT